MSSVVSVLAQANRAKSRVRATSHILLVSDSPEKLLLNLIVKLLDIGWGMFVLGVSPSLAGLGRCL